VKKLHLQNGELVQPILDQMQDELHIHFSDYCSQELDFLLLFQLKKLIVCIEIFCLTLNGKGQGVFEREIGVRGDRPFWFD